LAALAPFIGEVLGVKPAPIEYSADGRARSMGISGIASAEIEAIAGQNDADVVLSNHPFAAVPGFPAVVGRSKRAHYSDYGIQLEVSGKNGLYSPFRYASS
ncbi:MAG TPA: DUF1326 domain-containing protein, partial [Polyangiaceae bacterium]